MTDYKGVECCTRNDEKFETWVDDIVTANNILCPKLHNPCKNKQKYMDHEEIDSKFGYKLCEDGKCCKTFFLGGKKRYNFTVSGGGALSHQDFASSSSNQCVQSYSAKVTDISKSVALMTKRCINHGT